MNPDTPVIEGPVCAIPIPHNEFIVMGHGSGGRMTQDLIRKTFKPYFSNTILDANNDFGSIDNNGSKRLAISTDAHIVSPLFFPGGDIGRLAVCGTVNDVAMSGADPAAITASFIIEEGFAIKDLARIASSMAEAAREAGVRIVAGDTKVVEKGKADGVFISTTGIGYIPDGVEIGGASAKPGDAVIVSGSLGDHGMSVLTARGDLGIDSAIQSDVAPLNGLIHQLVNEIKEIHVLRDPTRGGLATTLNEIAVQSGINITINEAAILIHQNVSSVCELLGFDPLYVANEGKLILILPRMYTQKALKIMHAHRYGKEAVLIGEVNAEPKSRVLLKTRLGSNRVLDVLSGEMLPRIC